MAPIAGFTYGKPMQRLDFKERVKAEMAARGVNKAQLARASGVPYHTIDKFLKGITDKTSAENAQAMARALGIKVDDDAEFEELRALYYAASEADRAFLLETIRRLAGAAKDR